MSWLRNVTYGAFRALGIGSLLRKRRAGAIVLCYHNVVDGHVDVGGRGIHLAKDDFAAQMDWLRRRFDVVPLTAIVSRLRSGASIRGLAAVTFDDGYRGVVRHALPVLRRHHLPATLFVTVDGSVDGRPFWWDHPRFRSVVDDPGTRDHLLEHYRGDRARILAANSLADAELPEDLLPADWETLRGVGGDVSIAAHGATHRCLPRLDDDELDREMSASMEAIAREIGSRPTEIAYPYGRFDLRVREAAERAGFLAGLTLEEHELVAGAAPLALPRLGIPAGISLDAFAVWVSGLASLRYRMRSS